MAKIDIIADCKFSKRFSWLRALLLLIGVTFLTIPPDAWANGKTGPTISYLQILSIPGSNGYKKGDNIRVHLHWGTPVKVQNTPTLTLVIGTEEKTANYASGTGTNDLFFQYTVAEGDTDTDGFSVKANSLSGTITNLTGDAATLTHDGLDGGSKHQVEAILPTVSSVAFSSTGPYRVGSNIDVTVTMSETATVSGTPALTLVIGTTEKTANYTSGSGTTALVFRYTVAAGDGDDTDGVSLKANSLTGTITDSPGNTATLTHSALAGGTDHKVDTTAPQLAEFAFSTTGPYATGNTIRIWTRMSENVLVTGTPQITLVIGTTEKTASYNYSKTSVLGAPAILLFDYTVAAGDTDTDGVSVKANSLNLNGGTIKDYNDYSVISTHDGLADGGNDQQVDTTPPRASSLAFSSTGPYAVGSNIDVTVTMNETVTITGTPTLTLVIGTTEKTANYTSGSGTTALVFRYTVAAGDGDDTDGVSVKENALNLNGGTIKDNVGNAAIRKHSAVADGGDNQRVDATPPEVSSVAFSSTGPYSVGSNIDVTVTMNETVTITGTPTLTLVIGTAEKTANYTSGTGTNALVFRYTVVVDDFDADGVSVKANSLNLNGGTIKGWAGNAARRTHSEVPHAGDSHQVDAVGPRLLPLPTLISTGPYGIGDHIEISVSLSENATVTGTPFLQPLAVGSANKPAYYNRGSGTSTLVFRYTVAAGDTDTDGVTLSAFSVYTRNGSSITDAANNIYKDGSSQSALIRPNNSHRVDTTAPTVSSLVFTSTGTYAIGENINVMVVTSENVTVNTEDGTPTITLVVGTTEKTASYHSGTGTKALVFRYTVADGDSDDTDGVSVKANSLSLNSGTMTDETGNALTLTHGAKDGGNDHKVDATPPQLDTSIADPLVVTPEGPYKTGSNIVVFWRMSENVTVNTENGTPTITLVIGTTERPASYIRGSGTNALVFQYTVVSGDDDADGVSLKANSLTLNGGTIKDNAGNGTILTHSALADGGDAQRVDTIPPSVTSFSFTSAGPYKIGSIIEVSATMNEKVFFIPDKVPQPKMPTLTFVIGTKERAATYTGVSGTDTLFFQYTVAEGDGNDTDGVSVKANSLKLNGNTIQDGVENGLTLTHNALADAGDNHRVDGNAPTVSSLAFTSIGPYSTENVIEVTVTMSESVIVTGTPQITIVIGTTEKTANYTSGSGTNALAFQYTVVAGDGNDADGVAVKANSLSLNGGSIVDPFSNPATLTHPAVADAGVGHRVDTTLLQIGAVSLTSTGPYGVGSNIEVTVETTKPVTVTGNATLQIVIGRTAKTAEYNRRTSTNALVFQYKVAAEDGDDADGISVKANSLALNGGTILDASNKALTLNHDAVTDAGDSHRVDTTGPTVNSLAFTSTGPYRVGDNIEVTLTMSEAVTITGTPRLTLVVGTTDKIMSYHSGSGTKALTFRYTVATGDGDDTNGVSVKTNSLSLNGGTMKDDVGNALTNLNHDAVADAGANYRVETTVPQVNSFAFTSTGPYGVGNNIDVTATMSKTVTVTGTPQLTLVIGTAEQKANYTSGTGTTQIVFRYTVATGDGDDTNGVAVKANSLNLNGGTITDSVGNALSLNHSGADAGNSHRVDTTAPTVSSIAFTSTGPYGVGNNIDVKATMSESVTVTGTPQLTLLIGTTEKTASYHSGTGTNALVFRYTIAAGDSDDADGPAVKANSLNSNGGTITDNVSNAATLTHSTVAGGANHRVATTGPTVNSIAFTSTGPYGVGNNIDVTLTFSKTVTVTGTPQLTLVIGTTNKIASYTSGTGTNALVFRYTVAAGDTDTDGPAVKADSLTRNTGSIVDALSNPATLTHNAVANAGSSHRVDTTGPTVSAIEFTNTGPFRAGATIEMRVTMSETVTVTGTPQLTLVIGTTEKTAGYILGTGTKTLVFQYKVAAGDGDDTDGVSVKANALSLNGGTITDSVENAATLTHTAQDAGHKHRVDTTAPTVSAIAFTSTGPYSIGDNIDVTATMSETVTITGTPQLTLTIGNTDKTAKYHSGTGTNALLFRYTVATGDSDDTDGVSVKANALKRNSGTIKDSIGNAATLTHSAVDGGNTHRVDTTPPTVSSVAIISAGPYGVGSNIRVKATMSESVTVTGTPQITLVIGTTEKTAYYHSGTGTTELIFQYTVAVGDTDINGISVKANSLRLNTPNPLARQQANSIVRANQQASSIVDAAKNPATLTPHDAVPDAGNSHRVDTTAPAVSSIAFTSTGPYDVGSNIDVTLTITKSVTVAGTPNLTLVIGSAEKIANYHRSSETTKLVFRYTVAAGDNDADGVSVKANSLNLNGGSIVGQFGKNLNLNHSAANAGNSHRVDTILPEIHSLTFTSTGPYTIGSNIEVTVTTTKPVTVTGNATLQVVIGNTTKTANYHTGSKTNALIFRYIVTNGDSDDRDGVSVRANSLSPNGGSILDASNKALSLNHDGIDGGSGHRVDTTVPTVHSVTFTSTGPYDIGDRIEVTAVMSKTVTVTGTPTLTLVIGNTEKTARYARGSGTTALVFRYTITAGDSTNGNGISVRTNSLSLNGGTIVDAMGNALKLTHNTVSTSGSIHQVNTIQLEVSSVAFTSTGPYGSWDDIEVTVTTTHPVIVTGNATLQVVIGNREKAANYHSGSGTTALRFRYTVATEDGEDTNGVSVRANSLSQNGGSIKDAHGNDLSLNHDAVADAGDSHRVDTTPPSVRSVAFTSTGPYGVGNIIQVTVMTSETVQVAGRPTLTLIIGNREKTAQYLRGSHTDALVFQYTVATGDGDDPDGVSVKANSLTVNGSIITDLLGNNLDVKHNAVTNGGDSQIVGTTVSGISSLAVTSTGPYKIDDTITVTVQTTEKVTVTGIPRIPMIFGTSTKYANYVSGSGTTTLLFQYTVVAGDDDTDGIEIAPNALENNEESTIKNNYHTDVNLSHAGVPANPSQMVDTTIPKVVSVDFGDTSTTYAVGDEIEVVVTFEETGVQVNPNADGTMPSVTLLLGSNASRNSQKTAVAATYKESRPGSTKLVFTYTITEDTPMDVDGVQIKRDGLMIPTGASIHDASGNAITSNEAENGQLTVLPRESTLISSRPILPAITSTSVIFNEFLNANSNKQDWVELRNLSETDIALADWQITISAGKATKNNVVKFPDITLPAGKVLLLINTPHKDTRLALSKHFSYRYLLMPELQLPQNAFMLTLQNRAGAIMDIMGSYFADGSTPDTPTFEQDQAYAREKPSTSGYDATAWTLSGYHAGLGYDRNVPQETSHGTPGYLKPVSIPQTEIAPVSISEIMYVTGKSGNLPQWIEVYNASKTRIISMRGWKLQLELATEHDALHRSFSTFVIQDSLQILPNQTILIVTKSGRNSKHFPESRVYNLTQQHPDDIKKLIPEDEITGVTGIAVVLSDDRGNPIDIVGNLDGQSGTNDEPSWKLLNGFTQNGNRSSIIRQYENGAPLTGTKRSSWFRASTIKRTVQIYWGHPKDAGNPGWKKGTALPVQLSSFKAERTDAGAVITWHTESELENAGFNILRSETKNGTFTVVNPKLIPGAGTTAERNTYQYIDTETKPGQPYYYQLEDVSFTGIRQTLTTQRLRRNISPVGQRLTTFGAIKKGDQ